MSKPGPKKHADGRAGALNRDSLGSVFSESKRPLYMSAPEQDAEFVPDPCSKLWALTPCAPHQEMLSPI